MSNDHSTKATIPNTSGEAHGAPVGTDPSTKMTYYEVAARLVSKKFVALLVSVVFVNIQLFAKNLDSGVYSTIMISIMIAYLAADVADAKVATDAGKQQT